MKEGKRCSRCGEVKYWEEFGKNSSHSDGLQSQCRQCKSEIGYLYYQGHKEKTLERQRRNREQQRRNNKACYQKHKKKRATYAMEHREHIQEYQSQWRRKHPDIVAANRNKRRASKAGNGGSYTAEEWNSLLVYYGHRCLCCGRDDAKLDADHVLPLSMGGTSDISNIQPLCGSCNSKKHTKHIDYRLKQEQEKK